MGRRLGRRWLWWVRLRRAASLVWLRAWLGLRCYALCFVHALRLRTWTLWCSLTGLPSNIGLLDLLGLMRLRLLRLLESEKLLLLLDILGLSMGHLLWKVHL